jgi:16S rRNA (cytosine1402-N4)-methyltransferase
VTRVSVGADDQGLAMHTPVMLAEVLRHLRPRPGEVAVDCTLGGGGHAAAILARIRPGGRLIALDTDPIELPRTVARLRADGHGPDVLTAHHANFASLPEVLAREGVAGADVLLADLGVSSMQHDTSSRGFSYKLPGPLDLRMDPTQGEPASALLARLDADELAALLTANADEPHAAFIAELLRAERVTTTHALERLVRTGLAGLAPAPSKREIKLSVRRTFQALRIAVNDEMTSLERLLDALPRCLAPGGRAVVLTFHSGEDRRVKHAFRRGRREGVYAAVAESVVRSGKAETFANRRAAAAKLRWAVRSERPATAAADA